MRRQRCTCPRPFIGTASGQVWDFRQTRPSGLSDAGAFLSFLIRRAFPEPDSGPAQRGILVPLELTKGELMSQKKISSGVVHEVPADLKKALTSDPQALTAWEDITPLARNEWICWIESAKKAETRSRRIEWGCSSLKDGKRRPCCWPGCAHR